MRMWRAGIVIVTVVASMLLPTAAGAYIDTRSDPVGEGAFLDVQRSSRRVWVADDGQRYLTVRIRFAVDSEYWIFYRVVVWLDTRGDRFADAKMKLIAGDPASGAPPPTCIVRTLGEARSGLVLNTPFSPTGCRIPLRWMHPTKPVRWRIVARSYYSYGSEYVPDYAPNRGWYP